MDSNIIEELDSFNLEKIVFRIPLYQRPYSWEDIEVEQLLLDLNNSSTEYFVGNIVLSQAATIGDSIIYDVIDGQQRLTTLFLISTLTEGDKFSKLNISYEIRKNDKFFLEELKEKKGKYGEYTKKLNSNKQFIININAINKFLNDNKQKNSDLGKLLEKVQLVFTKLPTGTDITKYFEIMNNRGRQLEKHQILKAMFLKGIDKEEKKYATIWDVCSKMDIHVVDYLFESKVPKSELIQELLTNLKKENLTDNIFKYFEDTSIERKSINDILNESSIEKEENNFDEFEHYNSIIKFPIFLLHCLKLYLLENTKDNFEKIVFNDNKLIHGFKEYFFNHINSLEEEKKIEEKKNFIIFMFKQRVLFDFFIFKRDNSENKKPFLKEIKSDFTIKNENVNLLMIQLLFNINANFQSQDWITEALKWLNNNENLKLLLNESTHKTFYESFLIELENLDRIDALKRLSDNNDFEKLLSQGTSTPHYWFYKLDYLLWRNDSIWKDLKYKFTENDRFAYALIKTKFRLSRLNSIEHIHPQSKKEDWKDYSVDNFGNLALISNHMNSALNAQEDYNKRHDIQKQLDNGTIESLKMILAYSKYKEWTLKNCEEHQEEMINILIEDLNNAK
ncbi:DUF262 domain-containing protein [Aliarcobacter cryaerophilus]|uniref:DUF262 domain-containing protein n=1 Tax=Aliarcobacter cryaerophilus TaxID=28198 RepID=UPI003DA4DF93